MSRISVRKDLFAANPLEAPLISLPHEDNPTTTAKPHRRKSKPTYINPHGRHFEVTKSNVYKSIPNFGLWYIPPEDNASMQHQNVRDLELYNTTLEAECATAAEDCMTTTNMPMEQARNNEVPAAESNVADIPECVTLVTEDVPQAKSSAKEEEDSSEIIEIGPNGTSILLSEYERVDWNSVIFATRDLLLYVFDRATLLTHTLYGRSSHKGKLDPLKVADIVYCVKQNFECTESDVRRAIVQRLGIYVASQRRLFVEYGIV